VLTLECWIVGWGTGQCGGTSKLHRARMLPAISRAHRTSYQSHHRSNGVAILLTSPHQAGRCSMLYRRASRISVGAPVSSPARACIPACCAAQQLACQLAGPLDLRSGQVTLCQIGSPCVAASARHGGKDHFLQRDHEWHDPVCFYLWLLSSVAHLLLWSKIWYGRCSTSSDMFMLGNGPGLWELYEQHLHLFTAEAN
jgi:hypothetical protein